MQDSLALFFGLIVLTIGAVLVYEGTSESHTSQTAALLFGAAFVALGLASVWAALNNWLKWRKEEREFRGE
jgi:uncharacterized membrane protein